MYNHLFNNSIYPEHWDIGYTIPIFKGGDRNAATNYRGITLNNILSKIYSQILQNRLTKWTCTHYSSKSIWLSKTQKHNRLHFYSKFCHFYKKNHFFKNRNWNRTQQKLAEHSSRAMHTLFSVFNQFKFKTAEQCKLFDVLVSPILHYSSEISALSEGNISLE